MANCRTFPGGAATDRITATNAVNLSSTSRSYALWMNLAALDATARRALAQSSGNGEDIAVSNTINVRYSTSWSDTTVTWHTNSAPTTASWIVVSFAYNGSNVNNDPTIWFGSSSQAITLDTARSAGTLNTGNATPMFGNANTFDRCFNGSLAMSAAWNGYLLTQSDVVYLANGGPPCAISPANLLYYYPLDRGEQPESEQVSNNYGLLTGTTVGTGPVVVNSRCIGLKPAIGKRIVSLIYS
jgi:hypothetical protein